MSKIEVDQVDPQSGTTLTLGTSGDTVSIPSGVTLANAGTATGFSSIAWQSSIVTAATHTASAGQGIWINTTSNACNLTLPGSPSVGDELIFSDFARKWGTNAVTLTLNGSKFQGNTSPAPVYDTTGETVHIVYSGSTQGWIPINDGAVALETPQFSGATSYLVVAGGGGGGGERGGGGGAGGYLTNFGGAAITLQQSQTYTITVGTGGAGSATGSGSYVQGSPGLNSVLSGTGFTTITATGGGGGGGTASPNNGGDGGSGGGSHANGSGGSGNTPSTTPSQGNNGGGSSNSAPYYGSGGGGGANAVGANGTASAGGNGGAGTSNSITGSAVTYAGGGGGGIYNSIANIGTGGAGGGGNGGSGGNGSQNQAATDGTDGLGGGGGGAARSGGYSSDAGDGGNGIVILRMATADYVQKTGITGSYAESTSGTDTIISWTASGTIVF